MKISKRTREQAALICAIAASNGDAISVTDVVSKLYDLPPIQARAQTMARIAVRAWDAANRKLNRAAPRETSADTIREDYAEAEAMLRCGWSPK